MDNLTILLLAFGIPAVLLLLRHAVCEFKYRLRWDRMREDLVDIAGMDERRERWHQFLRGDGNGHKIPLQKVEECFGVCGRIPGVKGKTDKDEQRTMENDISHLGDELSCLTKRLQEEGESDEIQLGLDKILGELADQLLKEDSPPGLMQRVGMKMSGFFEGIFGKG